MQTPRPSPSQSTARPERGKVLQSRSFSLAFIRGRCHGSRPRAGVCSTLACMPAVGHARPQVDFGAISVTRMCVSSSTLSLGRRAPHQQSRGGFLCLGSAKLSTPSLGLAVACPSQDASLRISQSRSLYLVVRFYIWINHSVLPVPAEKLFHFSCHLCSPSLASLCTLSATASHFC